MKHYLLIPFTGLGLYNGFRGNSWLENRIKVFKHFVVPSLVAQTNQNFTILIQWRPEEKKNKDVHELFKYLEGIFGNRVIFTFHGIWLYDDKYDDKEARDRLLTSIHRTTPELLKHMGDVAEVIYTIQPSDDCYHKHMVEEVQDCFKRSNLECVGYKHGYIASYQTKEVREYNPLTNPPFVSIRMPKEIFIDPFKHAQYTALKADSKDGKYKKGTPCPSHEYYGECMRYATFHDGKEHTRGFLVGTHGENISTHFNIPYAGDKVSMTVLDNFGIMQTPPIVIRHSISKRLFKKLPHRWQRKLRYIFGERFYSPLKKLITA